MSNAILNRIVNILGSKAALAKALNTSKQNINQWKEHVPIKYCPDIEYLTNRQITCEEMRPDVNWSVLRNSKK